MSGTVDQVFTGDTSGLERAYSKLGGAMERHAAQMEKFSLRSLELSGKNSLATQKLADDSENLSSIASRGFSSMIEKAAGYGAALLSVSTIVNSINQGLVRQKQLGAEAFNATLQMATLDAALGANIDKIENLGPNAKKAREIMTSVGISDVNHLSMGMGFSLSKAFGDPTVGFQTLEDVARLTQKTPYEMQSSAEAIGGLRSATTLNRFEARNLLASSGAAIPTGKLGDIAAYGIATVPTAMMFANEQKHGEAKISRQHMALFGSLMSLGLSAGVASTATSSFEGSLEEAFSNDPALKAIDPEDIEGRFKLLQRTAEGKGRLGEMFKSSLGDLESDFKGKAVSKAAQKAFAEGKANRTFDTLMKNITTEGDIFEQRARFAAGGTPAIAMATIENRSQASQTVGLSTSPSAYGEAADKILERMEGNSYERNPVGAFGFERLAEAERVAERLVGEGFGTEGYLKKAVSIGRSYAGITETHPMPGQTELFTKPLSSYSASEQQTIALQRQQLKLLEDLLAEARKNSPEGKFRAAAADVMLSGMR